MSRIKDILLFIFFVTLIVIRIVSDGSSWIGLIAYLSMLIALGDLFVEALIKYKRRTGITIFLMISMLVAAVLIVILGCLFTGIIVPGAAAVDIFSILALIISLPHRLYISLLGLILNTEVGENAEGKN